MRVPFGIVAVLVLGACAQQAPVAPAAKTIAEVHQEGDWQWAPGEALQAGLAEQVSRIGRDEGRAALIAELQAAEYECIYGEAHEEYPEPAAQCTRSFATRACQFDWEVFVTSDPAVPDSVETADTSFRRDCVGTEQDWPEAAASTIDDQLAPAEPMPAGADPS